MLDFSIIFSLWWTFSEQQNCPSPKAFLCGQGVDHWDAFIHKEITIFYSKAPSLSNQEGLKYFEKKITSKGNKILGE